MKFNRRDLGYSIISRFESIFRDYIASKIGCLSDDYTKNIPKGVLQKATEKKNYKSDFDSLSELLECTNFPDLAEICCFGNNFDSLFASYNKEEFIRKMAILYGLRCKIAHVKGFFTSIDLDKLLELSAEIILKSSNNNDFRIFIQNLERSPENFITAVPLDFNIDFLENNRILNNLPIPDYDYEGGFVGREDDIKKILDYLNGENFRVITITGAGGVGKTSLALKVIQELTQKPDFNKFDGIIWLSAKENKLTHLGIEEIEPTIKSYEELLDTIIQVLEFDIEESIPKKEEIVKKIFEMSKGVLIIVDNLETITDERVINFIIDSPKNAKFLITSRKGLGQVERRHELKQLKEKEAIRLFRQTSKDKQLLALGSLDENTIKKYVNKVSCFPLAIKWVIGLVARGKDINRIIESINDATGDISTFCFSQIFSDLSENCKFVLYSICCFENPPSAGVLKYVVEIEQNDFEDCIEELIIVSLIIPEQFKNEQDEIAVKYSIIPLTKGFIRNQLNKNIKLREKIDSKIALTQSTIADTEKAKREYRYSLNNLGAITEEEKVAAILIQTALQKYEADFYDDAVENYKSALRIAPQFSTIYRNWAVMESMEGHWEEANSLIEKAKALSPKDPQIWLLWGNIYKKANKFTEAHEKYSMANNLAPSDNIILNAFAQIKSRLGEYETADDLFKKALFIGLESGSKKHEIINRSSLAENYLSWADYLYKDRNYLLSEKMLLEANEQCSMLIKIDPKDPKSKALQTQTHFRLGIHFKRMDKVPQALSFFQKLVYLNTLSNREDYYVVNGTIEYVQLKINEGVYSNLFSLLNPLKNRFPYVFQKTANVLDRCNSLLEALNNFEKNDLISGENKTQNNSINGVIIRVNAARNFVIIESNEKTFLGVAKNFKSEIKVNSLLINKKVEFNIYNRDGKAYADNISIN